MATSEPRKRPAQAAARRKYVQTARAQAADETRRRILDAVDERLRAAPTEPVSIDSVARLAGVARSTVYLVFGSRAGLFDVYAAHLHERSGFDEVLQAIAHPDTRVHLRDGIRGGVAMFARDRDAFRVLSSMAMLDPDAVGGAVQRLDARRFRGMEHLAQRLDEQKALRPGVSAAEAANLLWVLTSFDAFDLLYTGRGMTVDEVGGVLVETAERSLCR